MATEKIIVDGELMEVDEKDSRHSTQHGYKQSEVDAQILEMQKSEMRSERNRLLQESDWEITSELEKGNAISSDMKKYRQDLRDLPAGKDTVDKCNNATWPTKP